MKSNRFIPWYGAALVLGSLASPLSAHDDEKNSEQKTLFVDDGSVLEDDEED